MNSWQFVAYLAATIFFLYMSATGILSGSSVWFVPLLLVLLGLYRLRRRKRNLR